MNDARFIAFVIFLYYPVHAFVSTAHLNVEKRSIILSESKHPLIISGETLLELNDEALAPPAQALMKAGHAWSVDWEEVTYACADAADAFGKLENFQRIAQELRDVSSIRGCTSVGPASSVPNLIQLQSEFNILTIETGKKEFKVISDVFGELANEYS
jgi:hypothetical protein